MKEVRGERRTHVREVRVDRRKSDDDIIEHIIGGVRWSYVRSTSDDRPPRRRRPDRKHPKFRR
jgi:hypothetical protein